jgi:hypothetical protein
MSIQLVKTAKFYIFSRQDSTNYTWLSVRLKEATNHSIHINFKSDQVRSVIESDVQKCRLNRQRILANDDVSAIYSVLRSSPFISLTKKNEFKFEREEFGLRDAFLRVLDLEETFPLSELHTVHAYRADDRDEKMNLMKNFTIDSKRLHFHEAFDKFFLAVIAKHVGSVMPDESILYYQSFPCLRVVRPGEFSIGVHSDTSYGFSQANINFYVPLTSIRGSNSLVLESMPGLEDWDDICADYGSVVRFYGALCAHFTPENTTNQTRVSLDFRVIPGSCWIEDHDHFTQNPGYYISCRRDESNIGLWHRIHSSIPTPDYRVGFPFLKKSSRPACVLASSK